MQTKQFKHIVIQLKSNAMNQHALLAFLVIFTWVIVTDSKKIPKFSGENDILEKSEVMLKFPMYALKMPPIITSRKRTGAKVNPEPVSCTSKNVTKSLSALRKQIKCTPRDTVVDITAPDDATVMPNTVVVKRCGGMCSGSKKCISTRTKNVDFYVRSTQIKSMLVFCSRISVPEDVECECGCKKKKKCPNVDQKFDNSLCKCFCTNKEEQMDCLDKADFNFKWSSKTCACVCKHKKPCTTGSVWVQDKCRCDKS